MITEPFQWLCAALGAFMVGVSKAGITGLSILSIALFNFVFPSSKQASGLVLPLLIFGDCVAVFTYRQHTQWRFLWRLFPWTGAGVVLGYLALGRISDHAAKTLIGGIIVGLAALSYWRRFKAPANAAPPAAVHWALAAIIGMTVGFITLVANAAGPLMALYLVAMRLPKLQYVGTAAVFFMLLNLFKVPFMVDLGLITSQSFGFNLALAPAVLLGALLGAMARTPYQSGTVRANGAGAVRPRRIAVAVIVEACRQKEILMYGPGGGLLGLLVLVADVWALINIFQSSADTGKKVLWVVIILVLPVLGFILWYFLGPKTGRA